jgi:hypothetical protein
MNVHLCYFAISGNAQILLALGSILELRFVENLQGFGLLLIMTSENILEIITNILLAVIMATSKVM